MANPNSSPLPSSQSIVHTKPTTLPFSPSSPSKTSPISRFQLPPSPIRPLTFGGAIQTRPHNRSESIVSRSHRSIAESADLATSSSTHAGGILPSSSFFHPSKPAARPDSALSVNSSQEQSDVLRVVPEDAQGGDAEDEKLNRQMSTSTRLGKRGKQSREPLLPIGGSVTRSTPATTPTRPSFSMTPSRPSFNLSPSRPSFGAPSLQQSVHATSPTHGRDSIDKFRKHMSVDSVTRSVLAPRESFSLAESPTTDGRMTFEMGPPADEGRSSPTPSTVDGLLGLGHASPAASLYERKRNPSPGFTTSAPVSRLQHHSFNPNRPDGPDLSAVPMSDEKGRPIRQYTLHPSRNRFLFRGRLLTGGDSPWAFIASLIVMFGITGVYFGTTCVWWWQYESPAVAAVGAYVTLLTISSMLATAFTDPGILPRDLDPEPPYPNHSPSDGAVKAPLPRDLKVRAGVVRVKYCQTCETYRPPRSSHCKMCDNCVDGCDHHCQWVNNCIGRRNYSSFFVFLFSAVLTLILIIVTSALHLYLLTAKEGMNFKQAINHGIGSAVAFSLSILVVMPVTALLGYHLRLLILNATTIEQIRNQAHKALVSGPTPPNPFSHGSWRHNLAYVLCRPPGYSWLDGHAVVMEDKREINPGMVKDEDEEKGVPTVL